MGTHSDSDSDGGGEVRSSQCLCLEMDVHPQRAVVYNRSRGDFLVGLELLSLRRAVNENIFAAVLLDMSIDAGTADLLREGLTFAMERTDILDEYDDAALVCFKDRSRVVFCAQTQTSLTEERRIALLHKVHSLNELHESLQDVPRCDDIIRLAMTSGLEEAIIHGTRYNFVLLVCGSRDDVPAGEVTDDIMRRIRQIERHGQRVRVYSVGIGDGYDRELLQSLSERSHGHFAHAVDGYEAVQHIQRMLAQFSTLVATDTAVTFVSTRVNGRPIMRSVRDVDNDGHHTATTTTTATAPAPAIDVNVTTTGGGDGDGAGEDDGTFTIHFGDVFTEESYQRLLRVELDLTEISSEHASLPIATGRVSYSTAKGNYDISYSTAFELQVANCPDGDDDGGRDLRTCRSTRGIPHLLPSPIAAPWDGEDGATTPFVQRHLAHEVTARVQAQIVAMEAMAGEDEHRKAVADECLQLLSALLSWQLQDLPVKQRRQLTSLEARLRDEFGAEEVVEKPSPPPVSPPPTRLESSSLESPADAGQSLVAGGEPANGGGDVAAVGDDITTLPMSPLATAMTASPSFPRRTSTLHVSSRRRTSYQSTQKRDRAKELYAETLFFAAAKVEEEALANGAETTAPPDIPASAETTVVITSSQGDADLEQSTTTKPAALPPAPSPTGSSKLHNMADDGAMSESIKAIEERLALSEHGRRKRGTVRVTDDTELGQRMRVRAKKRQELVLKHGDAWADKY